MAVWNPQDSTEYNDAMYSDGDIESEMLRMVRAGKVDWYADKRWPVVYHFSHLRHNILNWYPFRNDAVVLEIGAGCGALTGLLSRKAKRVVALELTTLRARINYERHQKLDNLEVVVGDFCQFESEQKFDYIVINGVLEYAAYMFDEKEPYVAFLNKARSLLAPEGRILVAIENRFGLKYFAGSREDHTGKWFSGINNYVQQERVRTFTRSEIAEKVEAAGLEVLRFYYPYPDYKFPQEIFTDESINRRLPLSTDAHMDMPWEAFFNTRSVQSTLMEEKIAERFANSFLLEIGMPGMTAQPGPDYVKVSANRKPCFRIATMIDYSHGKVRKVPLSEEANAHLRNIQAYSGMRKGPFVNAPGEMKGVCLETDYLEYESVQTHIQKLFRDEGSEAAVDWVRAFAACLMDFCESGDQPDDSRFELVFGSTRASKPLHWVQMANLDWIADNLFIVDHGFSVIDYEWILECSIPMEYCLWRAVLALNAMLNTDCFNPVLEQWGIDDEIGSVFSAWELHFSTEYVGMKHLGVLSQPNEKFFEEVQNGSAVHRWQYEEMRRELLQVYSDKGTLAQENKQMHAELLQVYSDKGMLTEELAAIKRRPIRWLIRHTLQRIKCKWLQRGNRNE